MNEVYLGSSLDDFLEEEGLLAEADEVATGRVLAQLLAVAPVSPMEAQSVTGELYGALGQGTWDEYDVDLPYADLGSHDADADQNPHDGHDGQ